MHTSEGDHATAQTQATQSAGLVVISDEELDGVTGGVISRTLVYNQHWPSCG